MNQKTLPENYELITCPVCGADDFKVIDERIIDKNLLCSVACLRCSHVFLNPRAKAEVYEAYYQRGFSKEFNAIGEHVDPYEQVKGNAAKTERILRFLKPELRNGLRVLEIGCGYGNILAALRDRYDATVTGIEPDPAAREVAKKAFNIDIVFESFENFIGGYQGDTYDVILLHHVLEHMLHPDEAVSRFSGLLKPGGFVYIGVPNITALTFPKKMFFRFPHVSNFTPFSLELLLSMYGLKIVRRDDFQKPLSVIAVAQSSERTLVSWGPIVARSFPLGRVKRAILFSHIYHSIRLFIRDHIRPLFPRWMKDFVKRLLKKKI